MTSAFKWDDFQGLGAPGQQPAQGMQPQATAQDQSFKWDEFESLPKFDAEKENEEPDSTLKGVFRKILQIPKGLANLTTPGIITNFLSMVGTGEALAALDDDFSPERLADLRNKFPSAGWEEFDKKYPTYDDFRNSYLQGVEAAAKTFPTVENISRGLENATGIPAASKGLGDELVQIATGGATGLFNKLTTQPSKFSNIANKLKTQGVSEKSVGPALQQQLAKKFTQGEIIAEGRRLGMTDTEIAPLLNSERRTRFLSKFANKGARPQRLLSETRDKIGNAYDALKGSDLAKQPFSKGLQQETLSNIQQTLKDLPDVARQGILKDTEMLLKEPNLNARNLIGYRQKIQQTISSNPDQYKTLSTLKKAIDDSILKSNPQLAKEYHGINRLYEQYAKISGALKPSIVDKFVSKGEALAGMYGLLTLNVPVLTSVAGEAAATRLATEFLVNPRFQQLSTKLVSSLNQNKLGAAAKIAESMSKEIRPYSDEMADEIDEIDWENF